MTFRYGQVSKETVEVVFPSSQRGYSGAQLGMLPMRSCLRRQKKRVTFSVTQEEVDRFAARWYSSAVFWRACLAARNCSKCRECLDWYYLEVNKGWRYTTLGVCTAL